jgi:hypothetical protein
VTQEQWVRQLELAWNRRVGVADLGYWVVLRRGRIEAKGRNPEGVYWAALRRGINEPYLIWLREELRSHEGF